MTNSQRLAAVRLRLEQWLVQNACSGNDKARAETAPRIHSESILIRGGFYCGRQFDTGEYRAVWFMEEDELKISSRDGRWVCSLQGDDLVPEEVQPLDTVGFEGAVEADHQRDVITMPVPRTTSASEPSVESADDRGSDEQEIRRAA